MVGSGSVLARSPTADVSSASVSAPPSRTADDFRIAIGQHLEDVSRQLAVIKQLKSADWGFPGQLEWHVDQLSWITDATGRAGQLVSEAEKGDDWSARKFAEAGTELTAAIFGLKAVSIVLAYDDLYFEVEKQYPHVTARPRNGFELAHESLGPVVSALSTRVPALVDPAVANLLSIDGQSWWFDFSQRRDDTEKDIQAHARFLGWLNIVMLAWTAFDIWMLPVAGPRGGGGGEPPQIGGIGGMGGGGAAVASTGTVLATEESLVALRRLAAIGAITTPKLVEFVRGRSGEIAAPPKPIEASVKGRGTGGGSGSGGAKGSAGGPRDPNARLAPGLPSAAEDAVIERYTEALARLREKSEIYKGMKPKPGELPARYQERVGRARTAYETAQRALDAIEGDAVRATSGELVEHLDPLVTARHALETGGTSATTAGTRVACDAVRQAPRLTRGIDFAEIEQALGRPPDGVEAAAKPAGAGEPSAHQRLWWKFKDGSRLVVDQPRPFRDPLRTRPISAELPHVELHGPRGERLDPQGIEVPERSIPAHLTITDNLGRLESHFGPARAGR